MPFVVRRHLELVTVIITSHNQGSLSVSVTLDLVAKWHDLYAICLPVPYRFPGPADIFPLLKLLPHPFAAGHEQEQ